MNYARLHLTPTPREGGGKEGAYWVVGRGTRWHMNASIIVGKLDHKHLVNTCLLYALRVMPRGGVSLQSPREGLEASTNSNDQHPPNRTTLPT